MDGATALSNGAVFAAADLGSLVVTAPDNGGESAILTLTVSTPEGLAGTSAVETLTVVATGVAEAPSFGGDGRVQRQRGAGLGITLGGLSATGDPDDTLSATLSGIPTLWTVRDGTVALSNGQGFAAADLGSLVVTAPDKGGETASLTLTVTSSEGGSTTSAVETLVVTATAVAEAPSFWRTTVGFSGSEPELGDDAERGDGIGRPGRHAERDLVGGPGAVDGTGTAAVRCRTGRCLPRRIWGRWW